MSHFRQFAIAAAGGAMLTAACAFSAPAYAAGPEVVAGPSAEPNCFVPWTDKTKFFKFAAKKGPFRIALANGFIANTWRIQMIQTAKAYAAQPDVAAKLKEFKVVSTGEDVAAQIAAINETFSTSAAERDWAEQVVAAFAAQPDAGTLALDGKMIDKPHLVARRSGPCRHPSTRTTLFLVSNRDRQQLVIGNLQFGRKLHVPLTPDGVLSLDCSAIDVARKVGSLCGGQSALAAVNHQLKAQITAAHHQFRIVCCRPGPHPRARPALVQVFRSHRAHERQLDH